MTKEILCTLGPASFNATVIKRLEELGVSLFRINLSHTKVDQVAPLIEMIRGFSNVPICLDSEGAQVRTGDLIDGPVEFRENSIVSAHHKTVPGDPLNINFYPDGIINEFKIGDFISIDFNAVLVQVIGIEEDYVSMRVLAGGIVGSNKAVTVERAIAMPALTDKDKAAIKIGHDMGIRHFALSFANEGADVEQLRAMVGDESLIISKIECRNGLKDLSEIALASNALLIDRGDLSREVPIERIPQVQKQILKRGQDLDRKVYVATNLLESMIKDPNPTRAEVNDIFTTLSEGADGLVLAAETAIGAHPIRAASTIVKVIHCYENDISLDDVIQRSSHSLLVEPHGGKLHSAVHMNIDITSLSSLPAIEISEETLLDCEQIAHGTYSPVTGFMDQDTLNSVLDNNQLSCGTTWTMPILFQVEPEQAKGITRGITVALKAASGDIHATIDVSEVYEIELTSIAQKWFGTNDQSHPGVARINSMGSTCIAGTVTLIKPIPSPYRHFQLTPANTRFIFEHKGWSKVVGFHGRNPPHQGHTHIQLTALEQCNADGVYISPVIGPQKPGDFVPMYVLKSYQQMLEFGIYPNGKALLGSFATYPRFCGPREAVFTALCRQNMGCSHFIIGRDHTGVGNFYGPDDNIRMFEQLGGIGIEPVFFDAIGYNPDSQTYGSGAGFLSISGTQVRDAIKDNAPIPDWMMWKRNQHMLIDALKAGEKVFAD
jgi:pyruvate kinase